MLNSRLINYYRPILKVLDPLTLKNQLFIAKNNAIRKSTIFRAPSEVRYVSTYKGAVLLEYGQSLEIKEFQRKKLRLNEIRVAVHCCGVNASDVLIMENKYDHSIKLPFVPGFEICGEVLEVGEGVTTITPGLRVAGLNKENFGGFAEECVLKEKDLWPIDMSVAFESGASLPENYGTALLGLNRRAKIDSSSTLLITAAAGGLGLAAVDLAANVYKAKVIGVCGTDDKADLVREKGAWAALKYNKNHLYKTVKEVTAGKGVDVIFDAVGGDVFTSSLPCIANEGSVIVAGFASRVIPYVETSQLLPKAVALIGISLSSYRAVANDVYRQAVEDVIDMHESGLISPHVSAKFSMEESAKAFDFIRERKSTGKVVLETR